jgi:hypothetical protein
VKVVARGQPNSIPLVGPPYPIAIAFPLAPRSRLAHGPPRHRRRSASACRSIDRLEASGQMGTVRRALGAAADSWRATLVGGRRAPGSGAHEYIHLAQDRRTKCIKPTDAAEGRARRRCAVDSRENCGPRRGPARLSELRNGALGSLGLQTGPPREDYRPPVRGQAVHPSTSRLAIAISRILPRPAFALRAKSGRGGGGFARAIRHWGDSIPRHAERGRRAAAGGRFSPLRSRRPPQGSRRSGSEAAAAVRAGQRSARASQPVARGPPAAPDVPPRSAIPRQARRTGPARNLAAVPPPDDP